MEALGISFILEITQCIIIYLYIIKIFTNAKIKWYYFALLALIYILIAFAKPLSISYVVISLLHVFVYTFLPLLCIKDLTNKNKLYLSFLVVGAVSFINSSIGLLVTLIGTSGIISDIIVILTRYACILIMILLLKNKKIKLAIIDIVSVSKGVKIVLLCFVWELFLLNVLQKTIISMNFGVRVNLTVGSAILFTVVISCIVIQLLVSNNVRSSYYKKLTTTMENNVIEQVRHYQQMSQANENLRKFKHDFNNMIIGLNTYLRNNDVERAKTYLASFAEFAPNDDITVHTGDSLVNSLIADKLTWAKKNNIIIDFNGLIPKEVIDPVDLCIVFGNALDNAIEACLKLPHEEMKKISISAKQNADLFFIKITNPVVKQVKIRNNMIMTTKEDVFSHGIGLYSIRKVAEKYNGHLDLQCNDRLFITEIDFITN